MQSQTIRAAIHVASIFAIYLAVAMLIPAMTDLYYGNSDWMAFGMSSFFLGGMAMAMALATRGRPPPANARFGFLLINLLWLTMALAGAIPFLASSVEMSLSDAIFESVSGITTTGSTVLNSLSEAPPGILLWRSLLHFLGGLGVIALGLFLLPFLNIGGVTYFRLESSDIQERPFERLATFTTTLLAIYSGLVALCTLLYAAAGMPAFDAINHAMSTVSTGGLSVNDNSFVPYANNPAILWIGTAFMFIGGLPFSIMILFAVRGRIDSLSDPQIRIYAGYVVALVFAVAVYIRVVDQLPFSYALTHAAFNIVSIVTTTGFASDDFSLWGPFAVACIFIATFLGGCSGSTSGGIKAYRFLILFELMANGVRRLVYPNTIYPVRYGERAVSDDMQRAVVLFIASFFVIWAIGTLLLAATGADFLTSLSAALSHITNVGPGIGPGIGPVDNYSALPETAKLILSALMLLGRLEILAVLVVFSPAFWRR
ncbi:MAG: TrkH family potassium uptake protein [Mesorhizobium sp.]